ncbi:MAG: glycosyltransferase [Candidatus Thorarchaeota archaeon]
MGTESLRILHTSHTGLPDPRVEKTAMTMQKEGHELVFLGGLPITGHSLPAFNDSHYIPMVNNLRFVLDSRFKKKWIKKIDKIGPDIIHAHNLIAASMLLGTDYPVIYDDHEYWGKQSFRFGTRGIIRKVALLPLENRIQKWEKQMLENYPVLTVSENIAKEHRKLASHVGVTKNYPTLLEAEQLQNPDERNGSVYVGGDFNLSKFQPHRNMEGLKDVLNFDILSGLEHGTLMEKLTHYRFGLTPWRPHPFHMYCEPNKHYEYLIAGLQVILTSTLIHPIKDDPFVHSFDTYDEIPELLNRIESIDGSKIMMHSRERYVWEKQEQVIRDTYKLV